MSRTIRKHKMLVCTKKHTEMKTYANHVVRRSKKAIPNGMFYKKLFCTWDIQDLKILDWSYDYKRKGSGGKYQLSWLAQEPSLDDIKNVRVKTLDELLKELNS